MSKILNNDPNELELQLAQALTDLENSSSDLKADLRLFQLKSAREIEVAAGKQAIVIFVPFPSLPSVHKVQQRLTRELEKKFADKHVIFIAERRILPKPHRRSQMGQKRPRSRTLTAVHAALLEDLVYPTQIVGKRVRYAAGGGKLERVLLDIKDRNSVDYKLDSFQAVYKRLTGKNVAFEFRDEIF